jgi:hypothetical protein
MFSEAGEADRAKPCDNVMVSVSVTVCLIPPPLPATVK